MQPLTYKEILEAGKVTDLMGVAVPLHSNTSLEQCEFLQSVIHEIDARRCIEIGLAYGVSSLAICDAIHDKEAASLVSIDPFQERDWHNIGLLNLERAGFGNLNTFYSEPADDILPRLLRQGSQFDFAYVDAAKVFDTVLVQSHFLFRMVRVGGVIVFDDCGFPGVARAVRWISSWPHVQLFGTLGRLKTSGLRNLFSIAARFIPGRNRIFRPELIERLDDCPTSAPCVALVKIGEDERPWNWDSSL